MDTNEIALRKEIARDLISNDISELDGFLEVDESLLAAEASLMALSDSLEYPDGLQPTPQSISPKPGPDAPLPKADVLVVTWTVAEQNALADILTPGVSRNGWYRYRRNFDTVFDPLIRQGNNTKKPPSRINNRLGSWYMVKIGELKVICFKSELHLNQDGISLNENGTPSDTTTGFATLPVKDLFMQLIKEAKPSHVITVGTAGAVFKEHGLGDVVVTRGAKFRLQDEFEKEPYNGIDIEGAQYKSEWDVPTTHFDAALEMMGTFKKNLVEPAFTTPTVRYDDVPAPLKSWPNDAQIRLDGTNELPEFHPIVSTDFFEFGTSTNNMEEVGAAMEMGDAVLGLVCEEMSNPPKWLVIRNLSDPQINGALPTKPASLNMQTHWAVWYYEKYGYWTSVNSALTTWAVIAGLQ
jgi:nucleoside phosphorylase